MPDSATTLLEPRPFPAVVRAYAVHVLTASGILFLLLAAMECCRAVPRPTWVFGWFIAATLVDAVDGPLARRWHVKRYAPAIDGRTIDDIVDYLGFTFVPMLLVWRMGWVPGEENVRWIWVAAPLLASLLGFANQHAKDESGGFFRGFPSYWNIVAFYTGLIAAGLGTEGLWVNGVLLLILAVLTVAPIWLLYPNLTPPPWRWPVLGGAYVWLAILLAMFPFYPEHVPVWATLASLAYPLLYVVASVHLWRAHQRRLERLETEPGKR